MKKDLNKNTKKLLNCVYNKYFDQAREYFETIKKDVNNDEDNIKIVYLQNLINDKEAKHLNRYTKEEKNRRKYKKLGKKLHQKEKYELEFYTYSVGKKLTNHIDFDFLLARCYFHQGEYSIAKAMLTKYLAKGGAKYYEEALCCLYEIDCILIDKKERIYNNFYSVNLSDRIKELKKETVQLDSKIKKIHEVKRGVFSVEQLELKKKKYKINTEDNDIISLVKSGNLNSVKDLYDNSDYDTKISILAILYLNKFETFADKLFKGTKDELKANCPNGVNALNKNKTLYISKAKFNK